MTDTIRIVEVGPRDGLQNEKTPVSVADRVAFVEALVAAGLHTVEVGAFVSPKAVPQMQGSDEVLRAALKLPGEFHVLVPNEKGYEAARAAGAQVIAVFASASEGFSRANINCSVAESIEQFKPVIARAKADGVKVRGYVSCVLGCPFDGDVPVQAVVDVTTTLGDLGCYEVSLGDTIGVGTPTKVRELLRACTFTTPTARRSPISTPAWKRAPASSTRPPAASAAVPTRPARPAMSRPRTWFTCSKAWACRPASTWTS